MGCIGTFDSLCVFCFIVISTARTRACTFGLKHHFPLSPPISPEIHLTALIPSPPSIMKLVIVTIIALLGVAHNRLITYKPPSHMLDHSSIYVENLLTTQQSQSLRDLMVEFGSLNSNLADTKASKPLHEHIGEATAFDGVKCPHAYMVPDLNRISCILANRIDIGRHFLLTGGLTALKEKYEIAVSRLQSFGVYIFEPDKFVAIRNLFGSKKFLTLAQETCPAQKQVLDPFQFNLIVQGERAKRFSLVTECDRKCDRVRSEAN